MQNVIKYAHDSRNGTSYITPLRNLPDLPSQTKLAQYFHYMYSIYTSVMVFHNKSKCWTSMHDLSQQLNYQQAPCVNHLRIPLYLSSITLTHHLSINITVF